MAAAGAGGGAASGAAGKKKRGMALTLTHSLSMSTNSTRLLPYLVLGGQESVSDMTTLAMLGVTHILNVSNECKCWFEDQLTYLQLSIKDEPEEVASAHFDAAHEYIDGVRRRHVAGEKVCCMVHCKTGMSRSSTMVLNHLIRAEGLPAFIANFTNRTHMLRGDGDSGGGADTSAADAPISRYSAAPTERLSLRDALAYIRERRPRASPNPGFMAQLVQLETALHGHPSIDKDKYGRDRFGDVRTFCIGAIDPLVGYTGASAAAANDDKALMGIVSAAATGAGADALANQPIAPVSHTPRQCGHCATSAARARPVLPATSPPDSAPPSGLARRPLYHPDSSNADATRPACGAVGPAADAADAPVPRKGKELKVWETEDSSAGTCVRHDESVDSRNEAGGAATNAVPVLSARLRRPGTSGQASFAAPGRSLLASLGLPA